MGDSSDVDTIYCKLEVLFSANGKLIHKLNDVVNAEVFYLLPGIRTDIKYYFDNGLKYDGKTKIDKIPFVNWFYHYLESDTEDRWYHNRASRLQKAHNVFETRLQQIENFQLTVNRLFETIKENQEEFESVSEDIDYMLGEISPFRFDVAFPYQGQLDSKIGEYKEIQKSIPCRKNFDAILEDAFEWCNFCISRLEVFMANEQVLNTVRRYNW